MRFSCDSDTLVAPYRAILRYYRCDTPYRAILLKRVSTPTKWCDTPLGASLHTGTSVRSPILQAYRAIDGAIPPQKQVRKSFAILSLQVSRDMKSIATGPPSNRAMPTAREKPQTQTCETQARLSSPASPFW